MNQSIAEASTDEKALSTAQKSSISSDSSSGGLFHSILFESAEDRAKGEMPDPPIFFRDLNLDQIVDSITKGKDEYDLKPFFYIPLRDTQTVEYRHGVFRDLENETVFAQIKMFASRMRSVREHLEQATEKYSYKFQKEGWFLDAVELYCDTIHTLQRDLFSDGLQSRGLLAFSEYLATYVQSDRFVSLITETRKRKADLATVRYCLLIKGDWVKVRKYEGEDDHSIEVQKTFEKFKQGAVKDYRGEFPTGTGMNHIEGQILDFVVQLHPDIFASLDDYCSRNADFLNPTVVAFDREIQFYVAYLEHAGYIKGAGLTLCYPRISDDLKEVCNFGGYDLALAHKLIRENVPVVCNDFHLSGAERIMVVSGPNQGGKTTFARTFGQLHYLASLGCLVPGSDSQLFLYDRIFTHFEREETLSNLRGKLQDDLIRIHEILAQATPNSIIIANEIFTSTTLQDAILLSKNVMAQIVELGLLCVWVTFIDELASFDEATVSMVSTIIPENPAERTFKIARRPADGLAYAMAIAEKYRLTYDCLKERLKS